MEQNESSECCPEEDPFTKLLCEPPCRLLGWPDCAATKEILARARVGDPAAEFTMGCALEQQNGRNATGWYERAAQHGYQPARQRLSGMEGVPRRPAVQSDTKNESIEIHQESC